LFGYANAGNATITIDNISVKEYLGQEVVPDSGCGNWLLEPQSTNLINNSELLNTYFSYKIDTTITDNYGTSPSGETNSSRIQFVDDTSFCYNVISVSTDHTSSVFVKGVSGETVRFGIGSSVLTGDLFTFNGLWQRIDFTASSATQIFFSSYGGATTRDFEAFGLQLEALSYATSYIPTNGATNTRLQDIANNSGNSTLINSTEGVLYAEIAALANDGLTRRLCLSDGTSSQKVLTTFSATANRIQFEVINSTNQFYKEYVSSDLLDFHKVAIKYKQNDFSVYVNGSKIHSTTSGNAPIGLSKLSFDNGTGSQNFYGKAKALAVYKEALTDANLRCLTYPPAVATTFDLDFDTIAEQFTFTRGSEATFVNEQGLIESTASNDAPRIDYSTGAKAFLLEPQSTNLISYSEDFSNSYWTKSSVTLTSGFTAPDGTSNAYKVEGTIGTSYLANLSANTYTRSIYVRTVSGTGQVKLLGNPTLYDVNEEWTRVSYNTASNTYQFAVDFRGGTNISEVLIWGAQVENLPYATSYIPTSGAAATRNQELCNNATPVINSTEGTLYAEISALANDGTIRYLSLSDGTSNNRVTILYYSSSNNIRMIVSSNGTNYVDKNYGVSSVLDFHKIAIKYKENDFALWVDGIEAKTDHSGNTPIGLDNLSFSIGGGNNFFGNTKGLKYYPKALADVQLEDLTTI
jgi:hypothetical protein